MLAIKDIIEGITDFYGSVNDGFRDEDSWYDMIDNNKRTLERSIRSIDLDYIGLVEEP